MRLYRSLISLILVITFFAAPSWAAITRVQTESATVDGATNFSDAFTSNVSAGSLIVVSAARWQSGNNTLYVAGNLTKTAGTATIGTPVLEYSGAPGGSSTAQVVGQWSVLVTGSGSLTLQVAHSGTAYGSIFMAEYTGTWDGTRTEDTSSATGAGSPADSGNATSAGAAVFVGSYTSGVGTNSAITQDAAFTLIAEDESGSDRIEHSFIERIVATGTTDSASWTTAGSDWAAGVVVYKESGGGGGGGGAVSRGMLLGVLP